MDGDGADGAPPEGSFNLSHPRLCDTAPVLVQHTLLLSTIVAAGVYFPTYHSLQEQLHYPRAGDRRLGSWDRRACPVIARSNGCATVHGCVCVRVL